MFSADGKLLYATGELDADTTLATLGAEALKDQAIAAGSATGTTVLGPLTLMRLGRGGTTVLVASLPDGAQQPGAVAFEQPPEPQAEAAAQMSAPTSAPNEEMIEPPAPAVSAPNSHRRCL